MDSVFFVVVDDGNSDDDIFYSAYTIKIWKVCLCVCACVETKCRQVVVPNSDILHDPFNCIECRAMYLYSAQVHIHQSTIRIPVQTTWVKLMPGILIGFSFSHVLWVCISLFMWDFFLSFGYDNNKIVSIKWLSFKFYIQKNSIKISMQGLFSANFSSFLCSSPTAHCVTNNSIVRFR